MKQIIKGFPHFFKNIFYLRRPFQYPIPTSKAQPNMYNYFQLLEKHLLLSWNQFSPPAVLSVPRLNPYLQVPKSNALNFHSFQPNTCKWNLLRLLHIQLSAQFPPTEQFKVGIELTQSIALLTNTSMTWKQLDYLWTVLQ